MKPKALAVRLSLLILITAAMFLIVSCIGNSQNTATSHGITDKTEWIIMGDSYAVMPKSNKSKNWPDLLRKYLKLTRPQAKLIKKPGYGIARKGATYYSLLKKMRNSQNVRYIVIQSGPANDRHMSKKQIRKALKRTAKLIRKKYPNAKVYYCNPNWNDKSKKTRKFLKARKKWYKAYAKKYGWRYMSSVQNIYVGDHKWCVKDKHHPNARGARMLARAIYKVVKKHVS